MNLFTRPKNLGWSCSRSHQDFGKHSSNASNLWPDRLQDHGAEVAKTLESTPAIPPICGQIGYLPLPPAVTSQKPCYGLRCSNFGRLSSHLSITEPKQLGHRNDYQGNVTLADRPNTRRLLRCHRRIQNFRPWHGPIQSYRRKSSLFGLA